MEKKFSKINDTKKDKFMSVRLTLRELLIFDELAERNYTTKSKILRGLLLSYFEKHKIDIENSLDKEKLAIKQRQIHAVKFILNKFWRDNFQFQLNSILCKRGLDHESFKIELNLLFEWYKLLPKKLKKHIKKDMDGLKKFYVEGFFLDFYNNTKQVQEILMTLRGQKRIK